ncbi:MAG: SpoIID/LytB domain protein [Anaerosporomusa subterranea]|jgi:stage II sporulation protein D|nr:SpoIID/LytB domain protein [Anaerosporomusa subterranea]
MKFRIVLITLALLVLTSFSVWAKSTELQEPLIKVGLALQQTRVTVSADTAFFLLTDDANEFKKVYKAKENLSITIQGGRLAVNGIPTATSVIRLSFSDSPNRGHGGKLEQAVNEADSLNQQGQFIQLNGKRYRGVIEVRQQAGDNTLTAINILPMEAYLYGVIPKEISPSWPMEAIRAQAVAARSYAFAGVGKHQGQGFDVCPTVHCQVYGGRDSEAARSNQAVDETRGMMATYQGSVITAFFHSSSGGHTENSENVWGTPFPYLRGVRDFDQDSPRFVWDRRISIAQLTELLRTAGLLVGEVTGIELSPLTHQPVIAADRGVSGRVKTIKITGTAGRVQLSGAKFSSLLSLPSTLFDVSIARGEALPALTGKSARRGLVQDSSRDILLLSGKGSGHGIGLSQWGAKAMAEKAPLGSNQFYKEILAYYYPGATIQRWYK